MDEKHILVSLGDERAKEIAEVIGNKSCGRILDLLAEGDLTLSEISRKLKMPINTVDYNIKKLVRARLVEKASHWWSVKGKKMPTYRVSDRKIIISPRKSMAKAFAWVIGLTGLTVLTIREFMHEEVVSTVSDKAYGEVMLQIMPQEGAPIMMKGVEEGSSFLSSISGISPWSWFLIGAWFAVFLFFAYSIISDKFRRGL